MRSFITRLVINAAALSAAAYLVPGIRLAGGLFDIFMVALVFGLVNAFLRPVFLLLSLPLLLLTLGLFTFVVNGVLLLVTAKLSAHLSVSGLGAATVGSIVISLVSTLAGGVTGDGRKRRR